MVDETKSKIILAVKIVDNFIDVKERLDKANKAYEQTKNSITKVSEQLKELKKNKKENADEIKKLDAVKQKLLVKFKEEGKLCTDLKKEYKQADKEVNNFIKNNGALNAELKKVKKTIEENTKSQKEFNSSIDPASIQDAAKGLRDLSHAYAENTERRNTWEDARNPASIQTEIANTENLTRTYERNGNVVQEMEEYQASLAQSTDQTSSSLNNQDKNLQVVIGKYLKAAESVKEWESKLKDACLSGTATEEEIINIAEEIDKARTNLATCNEEMKNAAEANEIFEKVLGSSKNTLKEMQEELERIQKTPLNILSPEQKEALEKRINELKTSIQNCLESTSGIKGSKVFADMADGLQFVIAGTTALAGTLKSLGVNSDVVDKLIEKIEVLDATMSALGVVSEFLEKQKYKNIIASAKSAASMLLLGKAAKTTSTGFKILRGAIISTGIGALVVLIATLIANWDKLVGWIDKSLESFGGLGEAINKIKEFAAGVFEAIKTFIIAPFKVVEKLLDFDFTGAAEEARKAFALVENFEKGANEQHEKNQKDKYRKDQEKLAEKLAGEADALQQQLDIDKARGMSAGKLHKKEMEILNKRIKGAQAALEAIKDINSEEYKEKKKALDDLEQESKIKSATEQKRQSNEAHARLKKSIELDAEYAQTKLDTEGALLEDDLILKQEHDKKVFDLNAETKKKLLKADLDFGKIEEGEYKKRLDILEEQQKEFAANQLISLNKYHEQQRNELLGMLDKDTDIKIEEVNKKYEEAAKKIEAFKPKQGDLSDEEYLNSEAYKDYEMQKADFEIELEKKKQAEIASLQEKALAKQMQDIDNRIEKEYAGDLAKFTDNEREKNKVELEMHQKSMKEKKAMLDKMLEEGNITQEQYNKEIYEDEAQLRALKAQQIQLDLNAELMNENLTAKKKHKLIADALAAERELYKDNAEKLAEISQKELENDRELKKARIASIEAWANKSKEIFSEVGNVMKAFEDAELQQYEENNNKKKEELKSRLDSGLISQEEHDKQVAESDKTLDNKKKEIARKQAIREKAMKVFEIGQNTASAIMRIWADVPKTDFGISTGALTAIASAIGAAQLTAVLATPLPKASRGLLLQGPSHAQGGIPIEAEGGEAIINKRSTAMFRPLLSAINEAGGGVKFAKGGVVGNYLPNADTIFQDGGYAARSYNTKSEGITKKDMQHIMDNIKIYTTVEDYRRTDANYSEIVSTGSV